MSQVTLKELLEAGVHFGHQVKRWNPKMAPYIYTARDDIHVIDLTQTQKCLGAAYAFVEEITAKGLPVIFVGTKKQAQAIVQEEAKRCGAHYVAARWVGGLLTNWEEIKKTLARMEKQESEKEAGTLEKFTKKENLLMERELVRLTRIFGGIKGLKGMPGLLFVVDAKTELNAVLEAHKRQIPIVAICDTNTNPSFIDYPIPGNDDAVKSIRLITSKIADAVLAGTALFEKKQTEVNEPLEVAETREPSAKPSKPKARKAAAEKKVEEPKIKKAITKKKAAK